MAHPLLIPGLLTAGVATALALTRKPTPPPKTEPQQPTQQDINGLIGRARAMIQAAVANPTQADPTQMDCLAFDLNRLGRTMEATQLHEAANVVRTSRGVAPAPMPTVACPPPATTDPGTTPPGKPPPAALAAERTKARTLLERAAMTPPTVTPQELTAAAASLRLASELVPLENNIDDAVAVRLEAEAQRVAVLLGQTPPAPTRTVPTWCTNPGGMSALPPQIAAEVEAVLARTDPAAGATALLLAQQLEACGGFATQITQLKEKARFLGSLQGVRVGQNGLYGRLGRLGQAVPFADLSAPQAPPVRWQPRPGFDPVRRPRVICRVRAGCPVRVIPAGMWTTHMPYNGGGYLLSQQGTWSNVEIDSGSSGWVETSNLVFPEAPPPVYR